ncbi:Small ribosomal subunit uS17B-like protein [Cladobotryum mycophilum]|uniref:Small ribosomal subunit uS17B-like protein n=1 Tax=Cladobotryum mycophilum TaxID=491253 RepID=A0ABR0SV94_9HYPO
MPSGHPAQVEYLDHLGLFRCTQHSYTRDIAHIDETIRLAQDVTGAKSPDHDTVIGVLKHMLGVFPLDNPDRASWIKDVSTQLRKRYISTQKLGDLDNYIQLLWDIVNTSTPHDPIHAVYLNSLKLSLGSRYSATEDILDFKEFIRVSRQELEVTPQDNATRPFYLNDLGARLAELYLHTELMADLDEAISALRYAVQATPLDHPDRFSGLYNLGQLLRRRYRTLRVVADLDEAISIFREAVAVDSLGCSERAEALVDLGDVLEDRYDLTREDAYLEESIQMLHKALQAAPNHPGRTGWLNDLGWAIVKVFRRSGSMAHLEQAIEISRQAVATTPQDDPKHVELLASNANFLMSRYDHIGTMSDLEQAISIFQEVVLATPRESPKRASRLSHLGISLSRRYWRTCAEMDLDNAVSALREAVNTTRLDQEERAICLSNLGITLAQKYTRTRSGSDLNEALVVSQQAVDATPTGHPAMCERLNSVAMRLHAMWKHTGDMKQLEESICVSRRAIELTPLHHPSLPKSLDTLGRTLRERYSKTRDMSDLQGARDSFVQAMSFSNSNVNTRVDIGSQLLALWGIIDDPEAYELAKSAIDLVPLMTLRQLQNTDKRFLLSNAVGMASDATAIALHANKSAADAIRLLETGRGVITRASFEQHEIAMLRRSCPDLANSFTNLRNQLDKIEVSMHDAGLLIHPDGEDMDSIQTAEDERRSYREMEEELLTLLDQIRSMPGSEQFLLSASEAEMLDAASHGPVVIINVSRHRCDALIIEQSRIRSLPLPLVLECDLSLDLHSPKTLGWLWDAIVSPVLEALGFAATDHELTSDFELPRVCWVPTGKLSMFPLHAAGYHLRRNGETALDRVISSYATSVEVIIRGRRRLQTRAAAAHDVESPMDIVAVAMNETNGHSSLRHASREVDAVLQVLDPSILQHRRPQQKKQDVLSALENCKIFHFAGHGSTHPIEPLQSTLLLKDWQQEPLTVASILEAELSSTQPFLAYLSACGTSRIRDEKSLDESVHLANAFHLAGFRHVIGTLWDVDDELCVDMAKLTYEFLRDNELQDESVGRGLHHATRTLRNQWVNDIHTTCNHIDDFDDWNGRGSRLDRDAILIDEPEPKRPLWVPYVHFGI